VAEEPGNRTSPPRLVVGPGGEQAAALIAALVARGETVAAAESLTAGLVCATLAQVPGASAALRGGLVVYATELKTALAGVDARLLAEHGAVHPEVAAQLAVGARERRGRAGRPGRRRAGHRVRRARRAGNTASFGGSGGGAPEPRRSLV